MSNYKKPVPIPSVESKPYWTGLKEGRLLIPKCGECGNFWFPSSLHCPHCNAANFSWEPSSGRGKVFSYVVFHRVYHPAFSEEVPYVVALIELEEGPRLISNLVEIKPDDVQCDMPVSVVFEKIANNMTLPKFRPAPLY